MLALAVVFLRGSKESMKSFLSFVTFLSVLLASMPVPAQTNAPTAPNSVVARVNGVEITRAQLDQATQDISRTMLQQGQAISPDQRGHIEKNVLNQMIGERLMLDKAKGIKVEGLDAKVQERVAQVKKRFNDDDKA